MRKRLALLAMSGAIACGQPQPAPVPAALQPADSIKTGGNRLITLNGKFKVWTKKTGNGKIKVLLLHGGPGFSHDYM